MLPDVILAWGWDLFNNHYYNKDFQRFLENPLQSLKFNNPQGFVNPKSVPDQ